ncbi:MAG: toll/interleukin-1 receptor domain-containing protein [Inquilinus sp.]|uniref:toll/interleukin-1 receptor domain-containing protein n=1 Tax=Inquilinus sp. TaxID=1932117 RepID=UPI003F30598F
MPIEYRSGGRKVSRSQFFKNLHDRGVLIGLDLVEDRYHRKAVSVVDPLTGKHPVVMIRRIGNRFVIRTSGSPEYSAELERRLTLRRGTVSTMTSAPEKKRLVYLAHASEDKETARPIAEGLQGRGIETWFDQWEIRTGDSLRRKMEQGLRDCTHFVVLLSPISINKRWVNAEIDAGLTSDVEGSAKFMGLRLGLPIDQLTPFLKTRRCPEIVATEAGIDELAADILGVSRKPPLGPLPRYVRPDPIAVAGWSSAALAVAEHLVRTSERGCAIDPQTTYEKLVEATGLPMPDVRLGVLDLYDAGLLEKGAEIGGKRLHPRAGLFTEFDHLFMEWNPAEDAKTVAIHLHNSGLGQAETATIGAEMGWSPRRLNPAMNYLVESRAVAAHEAHGGSYRPRMISIDDNLLRFVRNLQ